MKSGKSIIRDFAFVPGPPRVPRAVIWKAVQAVIKARLEKEWGRPVRLSELKRDPKLPQVMEPSFLRWLCRARIRKTASPVPKSKMAKQPGG